MNYVHFFQWNIPADNQTSGHTNRYIDVIVKWDSSNFYTDGRPMVFPYPVNLTFSDCMQVKDWHKAYRDISTIAESHFADLAKQERINQARAILAVEENPIMERMIAANECPI